MSHRLWDGVMLALCAAWLLGLAVVVTGPTGGVLSFLRDASTAAWVQALGSIGAIVGAVAVANVPLREARRLEEQRTAERMAAAIRTLQLVHDILNDVSQTAAPLRNDSAASVSMGAWKERLDAAEATTNHYLRYEGIRPEVVTALAAAQASIRQARQAVEVLASDSYPLVRQPSKAVAAFELEAIARRFNLILDESVE